jgi:hypothetical protein
MKNRNLIVGNNIVVIGKPNTECVTYDSGIGDIIFPNKVETDYNWAITYIHTCETNVFFVIYIWKTETLKKVKI